MLNVLVTGTLNDQTAAAIIVILTGFVFGMVWLVWKYKDLTKGRSFKKWRVAPFSVFLFLTNSTDRPLFSTDSGAVFLMVFVTGIAVVLLWLHHNRSSLESEIEDNISDTEV
jgi:uncharacterized membrane protein